MKRHKQVTDFAAVIRLRRLLYFKFRDNIHARPG